MPRARDRQEDSISVYKDWLYYGFTKEKIDSCKLELNAHNAGSLSIVSIATTILILLLSLYPGGSGHSTSAYFIFAAIQFAIFIYSRTFTGVRKQSIPQCTLGMILFSLNLVAFSIYGCFIDQGVYVVRFLLFFLSLEVVFVFGAFFNLIYNILVIGIFSLAFLFIERFFHVKPQDDQFFDIINVAAACFIAMTLNWYISHIFVRGLLTAHSLQEERNRFHEESIHDQLTGLNNRRSFEQSVDFFTSVCRQVHQSVCVVMMDVDFFKNYNDYYGHQKGDEVLKAVGRVLRQLTEENRVYAARVGGEEFIVLWTENRLSEALHVVLKLRQMIIDLQIRHEMSSVAPYLTASFGFYLMRGGSEDSPKELYEAADSALYKAKEAGRNLIVLHDSGNGSFRVIDASNPDDLPDR
ncbi:MAG: GGDEF domain-containing protein [Spirochaetaceae bacterium]|jgi:diguanylate cyclase (GGDEF)-like protein|nr:GGDEF domain-containing protein [Spirochaetaceae bacterium]